MTSTSPLEAGRLPEDLEQHRRALTGYCYRMLGSGADADDAVQETMVRAWSNLATFEARSSLRSWLYRIATNVCLDLLRARQRRAQPMDMGPSSTADTALPTPLADTAWIQPVADGHVLPTGMDPAEQAELRESIRLAFVAALQHLPPRQRAVLILREVLRWSAAEVAALLDTTVVSVNSSLQRARATLSASGLARDTAAEVDADHAELLARYLDAFERYDVASLVALLHHDATFTMPPYPIWLRGPKEVAGWLLGQGIGCRGSRLLPTAANGRPAFGSYRVDPDGGHTPFALQVLELDGGQITEIHNFLSPELFPEFGLPSHLDD